MSLEIEIQKLTDAVRDLIGVMNNAKQETLNVAPAAPVAPAPAPVVQAPVVAAPVAAPVMPAPPAFVAPAPVIAAAPQATGTAPFSDPKGLIDYVMASYKSLGTKGQLIQGVLTQMGYQNINDVKPEHYGALFAGVEALK